MAALLLALSGCGNLDNGGGDGGEGAAAVQPSRVTPGELRAAATDPRLVRFYQARSWAPAWNADTARTLTEAIGQAPRHGLDPRTFLGDAERAQTPAAREAALSLAALAYAETLARGRIDPRRVAEVYTVPRPNVDATGGLNAAIERGDVPGWLASLAPQDPEYRALSDAYVAASRQAAAQRSQPIGDGAAIRPGGSDPRMPAIAAALRGQGYVPAEPQPQPQPQGQRQAQPQQPKAQASGNRYTPELVAAVRRLQGDFGLEPTGIIGAQTLAALNQGAFDRARTLAVNLERRRWLARELPPTRIDVNTAAAFLTYWRDGQVADRRRVVTGQPGNETPELGSPMYRLVANPTWTVPESIAEEEILPKGAGYMARNRMTTRNGRIVQDAGPQNSLGLVKFDMRNDQAIYLHDTPAKALFGQDERHRSHGCVRVQDALGFAQLIAQHEGVLDDWMEARSKDEASDEDYEEAFVPLPHEIPVRLMYQTAFLDGGRIRFRPDVYGWDESVAEALGLPARARGTRPSHVSDVGP
jgi:murein L,D-transpeptidase YcbB/YkuD